MNPPPVTIFHCCAIVKIAIQHAVFKIDSFLIWIIIVYSFRRFLLGKHKAAIEFYHEAARLNEKDWVKENKHSFREFLLCLKVCKGKCLVGLTSFTLNTQHEVLLTNSPHV